MHNDVQRLCAALAWVSSLEVQWCAMTVSRQYRLGRRAEQQAKTRQRIVEAAVDLHSTVGPATTSISAIAERAGVQRHTVYAHFPDETALFDACSAHWIGANPFPDVSKWLKIADPGQRLRRAICDVYAWYDRVEDALALFVRDGHVFPSWGEARRARLGELADLLAKDLPRRKAVRAAVGHALEFETWRSLVRTQGLTNPAAANAMTRLAETL
jgi:AcrR family transcriptional regulator